MLNSASWESGIIMIIKKKFGINEYKEVADNTYGVPLKLIMINMAIKL